MKLSPSLRKPRLIIKSQTKTNTLEEIEQGTILPWQKILLMIQPVFPHSQCMKSQMQLNVMPGHGSPSGQPTNIMFVVTLYFRQPKYRPIRHDSSIPLAWLLLFQENEKTALGKP